MKQKLTLIGAVLMAAVTNINAANPVPAFLDTVTGYFTSFNPNLTNTFSQGTSLFAGADWNDGAHVSSTIGLEHRLKGKIGVDFQSSLADVEGTFRYLQSDLTYSVVHVDTKLTGFVGGGFDFETSRGFAAFGLRVQKALTPNTYAGLQLSAKVNREVKEVNPQMTVFTGFTF